MRRMRLWKCLTYLSALQIEYMFRLSFIFTAMDKCQVIILLSLNSIQVSPIIYNIFIHI